MTKYKADGFRRQSTTTETEDFYPTPPWATRALVPFLTDFGYQPSDKVLEPACGTGTMSEPLKEYFTDVTSKDLIDRGYAGFNGVYDFLDNVIPGEYYDLIITNPPFCLANDFILKALRATKRGVAMLLRTGFLEGQERYDTIFAASPPKYVIQFAPRVKFRKDRLGGKGDSGVMAMAWFVWEKGYDDDPRVKWIRKTEKDLSLPCDFPQSSMLEEDE